MLNRMKKKKIAFKKPRGKNRERSRLLKLNVSSSQSKHENQWSVFQGPAGAASSVLLLFYIYWSGKKLPVFVLAPEMLRLRFLLFSKLAKWVIRFIKCVSRRQGSNCENEKGLVIHLLTLNNLFLWPWVFMSLLIFNYLYIKKAKTKKIQNAPSWWAGV